MSATFVEKLRSNRPGLQLAPAGPGALTFRVQMADLWDAVRVSASPDTPAREVKRQVLATFQADQEHPDDFVLKYRGWEILDEDAPISESGIGNGSILLLGDRRRRAIR